MSALIKNITRIRGYIGHLEVIAFPNSEIPHYIVPYNGFIHHAFDVDENIKKGTYVGTVQFSKIIEVD